MATMEVPRSRGLLRILGLAFGLAVVVGNTIGAGVLRTPGPIAGYAGEPWLIYLIWAGAGAYALLGANVMAEIAAALPRAGGPYVYVRRVYGDYFGFAAGCVDVLISASAVAYFGVVVGEYLAKLAPVLDAHENLVAAVIIASMTALNSLGLRQGSMVQQVVSLLKVAMLVALVGSAFAFAEAPAARVTSAPALAPVGAIAIVLALQMAIEAYAGWNSACYFSEETQNPGRTLPRAFFGGIVLVMAVYLAVNAALLHILPLSTVAASKLPAANAMTVLLGSAGERVVIVLAIVSVLGVCNATLMFAPRVLYAMARDGLFHARATHVTAGGTPIVALLIVAALALLFAGGSSFETLFAIAAFLSVCMMMMSDAALFILRWREPDLPRPYRAMGYPWLPGLLVVVEATLVVVYLLANPRPSVVGFGLIVVTWPLFRLLRRRYPRQVTVVDPNRADEPA